MYEPCGHCGFKGGLEHKGTVTAAEEKQEAHAPYGDLTISTIWSLARCPNCEQPTLETYVWVDPIFDSAEDVDPTRLYPTALDNSSLPARVSQLLDAALRVKLIEPSLYAVGIRRTLEAVCRDRGAPERTLEKMLDGLVKRGDLDQVFADMATQLRYLGNWGAHDGDTEVTVEDVPLIEEFADAILDYLYRAPAKVEAVTSALEERLDKA